MEKERRGAGTHCVGIREGTQSLWGKSVDGSRAEKSEKIERSQIGTGRWRGRSEDVQIPLRKRGQEKRRNACQL